MRTLDAKLLTMATTGRSVRDRRCAVRLSAGKNADVTATAPKKFCKDVHPFMPDGIGSAAKQDASSPRKYQREADGARAKAPLMCG